jgi:putative FmdB family regulatory protein
MPLYEYSCEKCERVFYELRRAAEREDPIRCPECGGQGKILFSAFARGGQDDSGSSGGDCSSGST